MMERHLGRDAVSGGLAGLAGAACMGVVAILGAVLAGQTWYAPLELVGGMATGSTARFDAGMQVGTVAAGALFHFVLGGAWGIIFGLIAGLILDEITPRDGFWIGAMFGIVVWVIDLYVLMPRFDPAAARAIPLWFGALVNMGFGATVGAIFPVLQRQHAHHGTPHLGHT
jgi:hypothetical protein